MHERWPRRLLLVAISAWIVLPASPSHATEIVEVRVGRHPEFTRVVFQLDRPAGYRVEKDRESGRAFTVRFEAASAPRKIESRAGAIRSVEVEPAGSAAVARIGLSEPGLRLKEMILANPPRIVLDVMHAPKPAPAPPVAEKPAPPKPTPAPAEKPSPAPLVAVKPTPPAPPKPAETPAPTPAPTRTAAQPAPKPEVAPEPADPDAIAKALGEAIQAAADQEEAATEGAVEKPAAIPPTPKPVVTRAKPVPNTRAAAEPPASRPQAPEAAADEETAAGGPSPVVLGAVAGVLLCAVGLFFMLRRRKAEEPEDASSEEAPAAEDAPSFTDSVFGDEAAEQQGEETPAAAADSGTTDLDSFFDDDDAKRDAESKGDEAMDQGMSDLPADPGLGGMPPAAPAPPAAAPDPDVLRVVHELERRMAQLEGKLSEANEARERLERQVAAQSEELRVQRAAIARTQRALRTLSRGEEEKATEPALRDDPQAKTRINV